MTEPNPVNPAIDDSHEYGDNPGNPAANSAGQPAHPNRRNQFQKVEEPKTEQFTGRATVKERERIQAALIGRKQPGQTYDIVRFCLDMMDYIEDDVLQTFKTK